MKNNFFYTPACPDYSPEPLTSWTCVQETYNTDAVAVLKLQEKRLYLQAVSERSVSKKEPSHPAEQIHLFKIIHLFIPLAHDGKVMTADKGRQMEKSVNLKPAFQLPHHRFVQ